jgi:alkyldihydroxyacetonephosphate synthase
MKRWNGWGNVATEYPLPPAAAVYLDAFVGTALDLPDASLKDAVARVPTSRLRFPAALAGMVETCAEDRLCHARGQSLTDWVTLRAGLVDTFPDAVAYPGSDDDVRALIAYAAETGVKLIPYGGGSSVVGHLTPRAQDGAAITIDMARMNALLSLDETSLLATFGAGIAGPDLEATLKARGFIMGHFPQSFEYSTLGGWIATRSVGQQSYHYGRIEPLFAGGHLETPAGPLDLPNLPASAAGPDVRQLILGSEGRAGIITRATMRIRPLPERETFQAVFFPTWQAGADAVRAIAQAKLPISMARLSDATETETTLQLSGKERLVNLAHWGLDKIGYPETRALLIYGLTGSRRITAAAERELLAICRANHGLLVRPVIGHMWQKSRFLTPYLRNTLWERGYALDTLETALPWSKVLPVNAAVKQAIAGGLSSWNERVLVFSHISHVYTDGASMYVTFLFRRAADPYETIARWQALKTAASRIIVANGGTISHQHGVGLDHQPYLRVEKGALGMQAIETACRLFDPDGMMNPGKLFGTEHPLEVLDVEQRLA